MLDQSKYIDSDLCTRDFELYLYLKLFLLRKNVVDCVKINATDFLDYNVFDKVIARIKQINKTLDFDDRYYLIPMNLSVMICTYKKWFKNDIYLLFSGCMNGSGINNMEMLFIYGIITPKNLKKGDINTKIFVNIPGEPSIVIHTMFIDETTLKKCIPEFLKRLSKSLIDDGIIPKSSKLGIYVKCQSMFEAFIRPTNDAKLHFDAKYIQSCEESFKSLEPSEINRRIASSAPFEL